MIARYTRTEMGQIWEPKARFQKLLEVETAVAKAQSDLKIIPRAAYLAIKKKGKFKVERILEIEKETRHDVIAFVTNVAENVGEHGKYVHFGLTSSDVLDTATSLVLRDAFSILEVSIIKFEKALTDKIKKYGKFQCVGRTHGIHAEPMTFGHKLSGFLEEFARNRTRLKRARDQAMIAKLSGPVGTYSTMTAKVEKAVAGTLKLQQETVATQVIPRDRHAEVMYALASYMAGLERLATELRHLQRTEVDEVEEGFSKSQKGSSAMPHKKNPIGSENVTGLSRMVRAFVTAALEDIVLWHERDISHSSVERVFFPDAFILADYATDRMATIVRDLVVKPERMKHNLNLSQGKVYSSKVLLALVDKGLSREEAYSAVQRVSLGLPKNSHLKDALIRDKEIKKLLKSSEIRGIFEKNGVR
jgi:adenylosuccinate lyase